MCCVNPVSDRVVLSETGPDDLCGWLVTCGPGIEMGKRTDLRLGQEVYDPKVYWLTRQ